MPIEVIILFFLLLLGLFVFIVTIIIKFTHNKYDLEEKNLYNEKTFKSNEMPQNDGITNYTKVLLLFEKIIKQYSYEKFDISKFECVYLICDSAVYYIGLKQSPNQNINTGNYHIKVEELLYNSIFKFVGTSISNEFGYYDIYIRKFYGLNNKQGRGFSDGRIDCSEFDRINKLLPQLNLKKRYEDWEGVPYYLIILVYESHGKTVKEIKTTTLKNVNSFVNSYASKNFNFMRMQNLRYYYIQKHIKEELTLKDECDIFLNQFEQGLLTDLKMHKYLHPENKWKSEQLVYELCKKIYGDKYVLFQYSPWFLGQQSYDVFITSENTAIEYQGKQHFEPVEFFGGEESFKKQVERDNTKKLISEQYGVNLVYINYDEDITEELIKERVNNGKTKKDNKATK